MLVHARHARQAGSRRDRGRRRAPGLPRSGPGDLRAAARHHGGVPHARGFSSPCSICPCAGSAWRTLGGLLAGVGDATDRCLGRLGEGLEEGLRPTTIPDLEDRQQCARSRAKLVRFLLLPFYLRLDLLQAYPVPLVRPCAWDRPWRCCGARCYLDRCARREARANSKPSPRPWRASVRRIRLLAAQHSPSVHRPLRRRRVAPSPTGDLALARHRPRASAWRDPVPWALAARRAESSTSRLRGDPLRAHRRASGRGSFRCRGSVMASVFSPP